ncbi:hypothetical protein cyc_00740 [Cyclospora cayetanensis]|uniref:Uncharacterized protein n=1 Tax=Cyclospora cayetanensis TaxID=88456 RepID=A0A1D3D488_9EIME|nr:hypothetical protein cyc_00740 [Cyclospora cayetanensis]
MLPPGTYKAPVPAAAAPASTKARGPRGGPLGASPKGRKHEGGEEELSAAESAAAAVLEEVVSAGAALIHKRAEDRRCFVFAAEDATRSLLDILRLCYLTIDLGEPGDLTGAPEKLLGNPADEQSQTIGTESSAGKLQTIASLAEGEEGFGSQVSSRVLWDQPPMPIPGNQDRWAPGHECFGLEIISSLGVLPPSSCLSHQPFILEPSVDAPLLTRVVSHDTRKEDP